MSAEPQRVRPGLRPLPFRGDLIAAGAIPLAVGAVLVAARMDGVWAAGALAAFLLVVAGLLLTLAWRAPVEGRAPRAYVSVLLFSAFPVLAVALIELAQALGGTLATPGSDWWVEASLGVVYLGFARWRTSAISALLGVLTGFAAVVEGWAWIFTPHSTTYEYWLCLGAIVVLGLGVVALRDRQRAHAVALADAAGLIAGLLGVVAATSTFWGAIDDEDGGQTLAALDHTSLAWGWVLVLLVTGLALVGYGAVDRERGPAWLGALVLALFVLNAAPHASLLWWPILLLLLGVAAIAAGLRPTTPTPPSPDIDDTPAEERRFFRR
jgi:hypothetical protein